MGAKLGGSGGGRRGGRRGGAMMSDINVTPMVDVMLVLLVIFMITAPLLTAGVSVDLPKAKAKPIAQQDNAPLEIALDSKGNIFMGENQMTMEQMSAKLEAIVVEAADRKIYIRADKKLDYGLVVGVMAAVNAAGFTKIALVTDPTSSK